MNKEQETTSGSFRVDPRLLDHFSIATYTDSAKAIGELVANCYDADATHVEIEVPSDWRTKGATIAIRDNGDGMEPDEIKNKFLVLGYNKRQESKKTKRGRRPIGSKGIGKLAGLGLAEVMHFTTTSHGRTSKFKIDRGALNAGIGSLEQLKIPITTEKVGLSHGTEVVLTPLHSDIVPVIPSELRRRLGNEYEKRRDFRINVNDELATAAKLSGKYFQIDEKVGDFGRVKGWYKILDKPTKDPGFSVRVRGRIAKQRTTFSLGPSASKAFYYAYIVGDVAADFLDPDNPTSVLVEHTIATDRDGFNEASPSYVAFENWAVEKLKTIAKVVKEVREERIKHRVAKSRVVKRSLDSLPSALREQTMLLVDHLVRDLPWETEEDAVKAMKALVESRVKSELMLVLSKLLAADDKDIKGFAKLLTRFGLADVYMLSQSIAARLDIIKQFERIVDKIDALELQEIHPIIENYMWLISDDYLVLSSNKQAKTFLYKHLGLEDAVETDRPDFICKSRRKLLVIIELKRGNWKLTSQDFSQVYRYIDILKKYTPNTPIHAYMLGGSCEGQAQSTYGEIPVKMLTYSELLNDTKDRYREFIEVLKREGGRR